MGCWTLCIDRAVGRLIRVSVLVAMIQVLAPHLLAVRRVYALLEHPWFHVSAQHIHRTEGTGRSLP